MIELTVLLGIVTIMQNEVLSHILTGLVAVHCTHGLNRTGYLICR